MPIGDKNYNDGPTRAVKIFECMCLFSMLGKSPIGPPKKMKKRSEETQTLRAGSSKAEPKIFAPS